LKISLLQVPYDSGHRALRMGAGPQKIIQSGLESDLVNAGHEVRTRSVQVESPFQTENGTSFAVIRELAKQVSDSKRSGAFPLVLAGNCNTCVGTIAGLDTEKLGVIWLDAHGDFNTPETTQTGFLDGMGLAMLTGKCWKRMMGQVDGFKPIGESHILLAGASDLDEHERVLLQKSQIRLVHYEQIKMKGVEETILPLLALMEKTIDRVYFHIDLDVLDPGYASANQFPVPGGLDPDEILSIIRAVKERFPIVAAAIAAYAPEFDENGIAARAAVEFARELVARL
jgi:arginase